jgi:hypothetical protein
VGVGCGLVKVGEERCGGSEGEGGESPTHATAGEVSSVWRSNSITETVEVPVGVGTALMD